MTLFTAVEIDGDQDRWPQPELTELFSLLKQG